MGQTDWFSPVSDGFCSSFTSVGGLEVQVILNLPHLLTFQIFSRVRKVTGST